MISDPRANTIVSALDAALTDTLGLRRNSSLEEFVTPGSTGRYLREPELRMALHFDIKPAFLILDPLLGSLGIVEVTLPTDPNNVKDVGKIVRRHIDTAAYARHLLLRDKALTGRKALTVELVLLTADETEQEKKLLDEIGTALRQNLRDTDSLFHIGVSTLCYAGGEDPFKDRIRRAFPWLLKATRDWLNSPEANYLKTDPTPPRRRLRRLTLGNYRLPGTLEIVLSSARVHLIHGSNGSGKSSVVEALELVSKGKVERLELALEKRYDHVIRNRDSSGQATITLEWSDDSGKTETEDARPVIAFGLNAPIDPAVDASSFRLDQPLMDRLIGKFPHERARDFLRAFFPEAGDSLEAYVQKSLERVKLSPSVQGSRETLERAKKALTEHQTWSSAATLTPLKTGDFPALLNRWLERTAVLDLLRRESAVRATIQGSRTAGWASDDYKINVWVNELGIDRDIAQLERFEREVSEEVEELQKTLSAFKTSPAAPAREASRRRVISEEATALNAVSRWLFSDDTLKHFGSFGDKLARVINAGDAPTYGTLIIGGERWAEPVIAQLDALIGAWKTIEAGGEPVPWPGQLPSSDYETAATAQRAMLVAGKQLSEQFIDKLRPKPGRTGEFDGSLIAAVNELMALFTPARWSYGDINLPPPKLEDGKVGLNIELGAHEQPVRAELHLNTAELNLFTIALFLLCAARVRKPLNLLVFDDPLQNMDELTSTALARGLAKIVRLWASLGRTEELLLLFHGQADLERFRSEIASATYRLPWLSPSPSSTMDPVTSEDIPGNVIEVQSIKNMLEKRIPAPEAKTYHL